MRWRILTSRREKLKCIYETIYKPQKPFTWMQPSLLEWSTLSNTRLSCFFFLFLPSLTTCCNKIRAVIKIWGPGISPSYFYRKIEPKQIPSCLIPHLLVVFTQQLEILVTALQNDKKCQYWHQKRNFQKNKAICSLSFVFGTAIGYLRWKAKILFYAYTDFFTCRPNQPLSLCWRQFSILTFFLQ